MRRRALLLVPLLLLAACGGKARGNGVVKIEGPSFEPRRVPIRTLAPAPTFSPTPIPVATATPVPTATPPPVPPPSGATITSHAGTQSGVVGSYCWSDQVGGQSQCYKHPTPVQNSTIKVKPKEKVILRIAAQIPPDEESIRPFQGTRSGYPDQTIQPALETDLTVDLQEGTWSMDLCGTWHDRGQPICWLFKMVVSNS